MINNFGLLLLLSYFFQGQILLQFSAMFNILHENHSDSILNYVYHILLKPADSTTFCYGEMLPFLSRDRHWSFRSLFPKRRCVTKLLTILLDVYFLTSYFLTSNGAVFKK